MSLTKSQYDEIMRGYHRRQALHRREAETRISAIYKKFPRLEEINHLISSISVSTAKALLLNPEEDSMESYRQTLAALRAEKADILSASGYSEDALLPHYDCQDCRDTGYLPTGKKCHCFRRQELDILYSQSNIQDIVAQENFNTFSYQYYSDTYIDPATEKSALVNMKNVTAICKEFVHRFPAAENLFFYGETGVGKTFLSNCIAKELMDRFFSVIYLSSVQLFELLAEDTFSRSSQAVTTHTQDILECDLFIIDDLGTELSNAFTVSALFNCLNERLLRKHSTIISCNLSLENIRDRYGERLFSRLLGNYKILKMYGEDIRLKKGKI